MISLRILEDKLGKLENDAALFPAGAFDARADAMEEIDLLTDAMQALWPDVPAITLMNNRIQKLKQRLEKADRNLFDRLRAEIRTTRLRGPAFRALVADYISTERQDAKEPGYNNLDLFINELFSGAPVPEPVKQPETGMVYYQKTPARIVFEMAAASDCLPDDVFVDIGCGLGQAVMLFHLLTGVKSTGIEFEPAYCDYARDCASALDLSEVRFINENALHSDYSSGTIFFLYTPFTGALLQQVLELLRQQSVERKIRLVTYGPCSETVTAKTWLRQVKGDARSPESLCFFESGCGIPSNHAPDVLFSANR